MIEQFSPECGKVILFFALLGNMVVEWWVQNCIRALFFFIQLEVESKYQWHSFANVFPRLASATCNYCKF